jgi:hypothetical protein
MAERITRVELKAFTNGCGRRAILSVVHADGRKLDVASPSEPGEPSGVAKYEFQKNEAVRLAGVNKASLLIIDQDAIAETLRLKREIARRPKMGFQRLKK